ncbi:MAG: hypothetical protein KAT65_22520 [Methanophagales archaeon]|nr:hypothetical protein [Methanophagales archaeon]
MVFEKISMEISNTKHIKSCIYKKKSKSSYTDILNLAFIILSLSDEIAGEKMKGDGEGMGVR